MAVDTRENVIVVGGGGAGAATARLLAAKLDAARYRLVLINPRPYWVFLPAAARLTVSAGERLENTALIPLDRLFAAGRGTLRVGTVVAVRSDGDGARGGRVVLGDGEEVPFAALVLAPGSVWEGPLAFPDAAADVLPFIASQRKAFEAARSIALVGGGSVGIEFAGEIKDIWPDKKVTIIQGDRQLMNKAYPDKFRRSLEKRARARGVQLVFGEYVDTIPPPGTPATTRAGTVIAADLVVQTRGPKPNTAFLASLGDGVLTAAGRVRVRPTLQLARHDAIFAAGDVLDVVEEKQLAKAAAHAAVVAANVLAFLGGQPLKASYKGSPEMIIVTNGRGGGAGYIGLLWGILVGDFLSKTLKSKTLMVDIGRKGFGY